MTADTAILILQALTLLFLAVNLFGSRNRRVEDKTLEEIEQYLKADIASRQEEIKQQKTRKASCEQTPILDKIYAATLRHRQQHGDTVPCTIYLSSTEILELADATYGYFKIPARLTEWREWALDAALNGTLEYLGAAMVYPRYRTVTAYRRFPSIRMGITFDQPSYGEKK